MADDVIVAQHLTKSYGATRGVIDLGGAHDMAYWVKALDTTPEKLRAAVQAVGTDAVKVTEYLKPDRNEQPPSSPQIPDGG